MDPPPTPLTPWATDGHQTREVVWALTHFGPQHVAEPREDEGEEDKRADESFTQSLGSSQGCCLEQALVQQPTHKDFSFTSVTH